MFTEDCNEVDDALIAEGRLRQRAGGVQISEEQFTRWLADGRARNAKLTLTLDGLMFVDERPTVHNCAQPPFTIVHPADPLGAFDGFVSAVRARLEAGRTEYGDRSFSKPPAEIIGELQQEALDLAGWGFILYCRLAAMREVAGGCLGTSECASYAR